MEWKHNAASSSSLSLSLSLLLFLSFSFSLSAHVFRKRRIFLPDKWNSWSNAREWDNAERMRWFSRTCDTSTALSSSRSDLDDSSARLQKRITGTKISHRPVAMHACTYREVTWYVIRYRLFGTRNVIRVFVYAHVYAPNGSHSFLLWKTTKNIKYI